MQQLITKISKVNLLVNHAQQVSHALTLQEPYADQTKITLAITALEVSEAQSNAQWELSPRKLELTSLGTAYHVLVDHIALT